MSQNRTSTDFPGSSQPGAGSGSQKGSSSQSDRSTMSGSSLSGGASTGNAGGSSTGTGTATGLAQTAQQYGERISEAAGHAREFVTDKMGVVGDKFKELQNADLGEIAENAKDYARKNPGQAILISAAAGLLIGLVIRGSRRS